MSLSASKCVSCNLSRKKFIGKVKRITTEDDFSRYQRHCNSVVTVGSVFCAKCRFRIYRTKTSNPDTSETDGTDDIALDPDFQIGPVILPERLIGENYLQFLKDDLHNLLFPENSADSVPLIRRTIIFMHDGCPAHYAAPVRQHLNQSFGERWIGRGAPYWRWPPRSPDLNPLDFHLWGTIKEMVYFKKIEDAEDLRERLEVVFGMIESQQLQNATSSVLRRASACVQRGGGHFENFL